MKILFITNEYDLEGLSNTGGIGRHYKELSNSLVSAGHQVVIFGANNIDIDKSINGIEFKIFKRTKLGFKYLRFLEIIINKIYFTLHFRKLIKNNKIDVIELNDPIYAIVVSLLNGNIPTYLRQHGMSSILNVMYGNGINRWSKLIEKIAHHRVTAIIAVSNYVKRLVHDLYGNKLEVYVVHNGIRVSKTAPRKKINTLNSCNLLYVAALSEHKGYNELVDAFNELVLIKSTITLTIVGRSSDMSFKDLGFSSIAQKRVKYLGFLDYKSLSKIYCSSNVFLNFTRGETFGFTTIEAMSNGIPVIVSNIGVAEEIVQNSKTGFIVNPYNRAEVMSKIIKLLDDNTLQKDVGISGYEYVKKHFSNELLCQNTLSIYKKGINES